MLSVDPQIWAYFDVIALDRKTHEAAVFVHQERPQVEIREARIEDFEPAVALYREFGGGVPVAEGEAGFAQWQTLLGHPGTTVHVAAGARRILAAATLHILPNMTYGGLPYALTENVIAARDHQGTGLGRQIMERAIQAAWRADV